MKYSESRSLPKKCGEFNEKGVLHLKPQEGVRFYQIYCIVRGLKYHSTSESPPLYIFGKLVS